MLILAPDPGRGEGRDAYYDEGWAIDDAARIIRRVEMVQEKNDDVSFHALGRCAAVHILDDICDIPNGCVVTECARLSWRLASAVHEY
jgi:hypothetical protein